MQPIDRRRRKRLRQRERKRRRTLLAVLGMVPLMVASFIWLVIFCSTGRSNNSVSPEQLGEMLINGVAATSAANGVALAVLILSLLKLVSAWWQMLTRRK